MLERKLQLIGPKIQYSTQGIHQVVLNKIDLLLINYHEFYLIENKCGHFGISLADGRLTDNAIVCSGHGISFDLVTGKKINRPYENCDDIKTYPVTEIDENLYCCLTQPIQS